MSWKKILIGILFLLISAKTGFCLEEKRVDISDGENGLKNVRVYLNYEDPSIETHVMRQTNWEYVVNLPLSSRWQVKEAHLYLKYVSSIALKPTRSLLAIGLNHRVLMQRALNREDVREEVELSLPAEEFKDYNKLFFRANQHYIIEGCEDEAAPELWTELDIKNSYVDLVVKEVNIPEQISSIYSYLFDKKSIIRENIHFVFPKTIDDQSLFWSAFLAGSMGKYLSYRDISITAGMDFDNTSDNIVIGLRPEVKERLLGAFGPDSFGDVETLNQKLRGHVNMLANPVAPVKGLLVITGSNQEELNRAVLAFPSLDFTAYSEGYIFIRQSSLPEPATAYSSPGFIPVGEKVKFSELGFSTTTFSDMIPPPASVKYKVYPDYFFNPKGQMKLYIHLLYPRVIRFDSIMNFFNNEKFIYQAALERTEREKEGKVQEWLDIDKLVDVPVYLVNKGENDLAIQSRMIPFKKGKCEIYNRDNLRVTLVDDSYIKLPEAKQWVEMPYLDYIASAVYPYSIYPDLSDTAIVLTDTSPITLASSLQVAFFLAKEIGYPPYRLTVTTQVEEVKDKHIILVGGNNDAYRNVMKGAPLEFTAEGVRKRTRFVDKFMGNLPFFSEERLDKKRYTLETLESDGAIKRLVAQMYRSPFNSEKTIFSLISDDADNLLIGVRKLLSPEMLGSLKGDVTILAEQSKTELADESKPETTDESKTEPAEESKPKAESRDLKIKYVIKSFDIKKKYYQGDISIYDKLRFFISAHPVLLLIASLLVVMLLVIVMRNILNLYKQRHHGGAESS